jgi:hypothetical protein
MKLKAAVCGGEDGGLWQHTGCWRTLGQGSILRLTVTQIGVTVVLLTCGSVIQGNHDSIIDLVVLHPLLSVRQRSSKLLPIRFAKRPARFLVAA